MNNILRNVLMRRSTSQLDMRPIQDDELMEILEEGKMLSNAARNQEWHFTVLQNRGLMKQLGASYEKMVARVHGDIWGDPAVTGRILVESALLLIVSGHRDSKFAEDAANMVFGGMMLVAEKYGIGSCWLTSAPDMLRAPETQKVLEQLSIPAGYEPLSVGVFGYKRTFTPPHVLASADNIVNIVK